MKKIAAFFCWLLYLLPAFFSCTKNVDSASTQIASTNAFASNQMKSLSNFAPRDSLAIKGDTSNGDETAMVQTSYPDNTIDNFVSFTALNADLSGNNGIDRSLMKFSLRNFPDTAGNFASKIKKAVLYLYQYHRPADQDPYAVEQSSDNSIELHRIVSDWDASTVTWNTQPKLAKGSADSTQDVVIIPAVVTPLPLGTNDNQAVDVTNMVKRMIRSGTVEGFLMKLTTAGEHSLVAGRAYGSFACPFVARRPRLVLYF